MEPFTPVALRGPVPIPPQRANKAATAVSSGINQTKLPSAVPPNVINSLSGPQTKPGNVMSIGSCWFLYSDKFILLIWFFWLIPKIQCRCWPPTLALRTVLVTLWKWKRRRITRIASYPPGSNLPSLLCLHGKPPMFHQTPHLLRLWLKRELPQSRPIPSHLIPNQSEFTITVTLWLIQDIPALNKKYPLPGVSHQGSTAQTGHCLVATVPLQTPWGRLCSPARRDKENTS